MPFLFPIAAAERIAEIDRDKGIDNKQDNDSAYGDIALCRRAVVMIAQIDVSLPNDIVFYHFIIFVPLCQ